MSKRAPKFGTIGAATALVGIASLLSQVMGLLRDHIIAKNFGTTVETDIYNTAFIIPDFIFNLFIAGALTAAFLPIFSENLITNKKKANEIANTMLTTASLVVITLTAIAFIFIEPITTTFFPHTPPEMQQDLINMTRIMLPSALFFAISNTLGNILMSYKHFLSYALSPIFYNLGLISGILLLSDRFGIYSAGIGVIFGAFLHGMVRLIDIGQIEYKFKPQLKVKSPEFKKIIKLMIPKAISLASWQTNMYFFSTVGASMMIGAYGAFNYARNLQSIAVNLFGVSFATAVFPHLAEAITKKDHTQFTKHIQTTIQNILFFTIPSAIGLAMLGKPIIELILAGGKFDENSIKLTSTILMFFAFSIPLEALSYTLSRSFYALKNTLTPTIAHVISMTIMACITIFIAPKFGIEWFSIGFTIGFGSYVLLMTILLSKHLTDFKVKQFLTNSAKTILATSFMALIIWLTYRFPLSKNIEILQTIYQLILGGGSFLLAAYLLKSPEIHSLRFIFKKLVKRA